MAGSEFNFFQLDGTGVEGGGAVGVAEQGRTFDKRMSNFGDLASTPVNVFKAKDELSNQFPDKMDRLANENPLVWGSTVKYIRDDKFIRMAMGPVGTHGADVNDKNASSANADYYLPLEGWRSFGGKLDAERAYQGSRLQG